MKTRPQNKIPSLFKTLSSLAASAMLLAPSALFAASAEDVRINEVDADTTGTDMQEFVELYDGGDGNTALDGLVVVFWNGNGDVSYAAYDLDGYSTNTNGYFVIGNTAVPNVSAITFGSNGLQNGADAVGLYLDDAASFPNGTGVIATNLLDAVIYSNNDTIDGELIATLAPGFTQLLETSSTSMSRFPDGGTAFDSSVYVNQDPTPGTTNSPSVEISLSFIPSVISESGATTSSTVTISLDVPAPVGGLTVTIAYDDPSEVSMPDTVVIAEGSTTGTFQIDAVDDLWPDGSQTVKINATAPGFAGAEDFFTVDDDLDSDPGIVLNEIFAAVSFTTGDANQDGTGNSDDEFVELVNTTGSDLDLSGYQIKDYAGAAGFSAAAHVFPAGTILPDGCAIVVFGSGAMVEEGRVGAFGGAFVQKSSNTFAFGLNLTDTGDLVSIQNPAGVEVAGHLFGDTIGLGSVVRSPDLTGSFTTSFFTPGYQGDNSTPFCPIPEQLMLSITPDPATEGGVDGTLTVSVATNVSADTLVTLVSNDTTEATVASSVTILSGTNAITTPVMFPDDTAGDGTTTVVISASSTDLLSGNVSFSVDDDGDAQATIVINEVDYDPVGTDSAGTEFVELYDGGAGNTALDGFVLVFYNGNASDDTVYGTVDLGGQQTDANGYYVATTAANGIQNGGSGGDGIALFLGVSASEFTGTNVNTIPGSATLVDSLVYEAGDGGLLIPLNYTGADLTDNGSADGGISRIPNGTGPFQLAPLTRGTTNSGSGSGYTTWAAGFPGIGDPDEDSDADGLLNLVEYALGKNPLASDASPGLITSLSGSGKLQVSLAKGGDAGSDPLIVYTVQTSPDLINWAASNVSTTTDTSSALVAEYTGTESNIFMRLLVTYP
jgi:hypothetical protein